MTATAPPALAGLGGAVVRRAAPHALSGAARDRAARGRLPRSAAAPDRRARRRGRGVVAPGRGRRSAARAPRPAPAVLFLHGNYELVDEWVGAFEPLRAAGIGVLVVEYPGYGRSTGVPTQQSVTGLAVAAWDLLAAKQGEVDAERIIALGRSVGGGLASALSLRRPLGALVLSSAFTGIRAYARRYLLPGFLLRYPFDNLSAVRAFRGPVLVQHGTRDRTVPFAHGAALAAAGGDAELIRYDCGHNDCPWDRMLQDMIAFLSRRGLLEAGGGAGGNPPGASGVG
ncbi:MAG: alpha/beta fold hydrolase [Gemmatimonadetes bacterium]|nr:alpha/beta fold hydrolase [Gemmatimonadota bacterium]